MSAQDLTLSGEITESIQAGQVSLENYVDRFDPNTEINEVCGVH